MNKTLLLILCDFLLLTLLSLVNWDDEETGSSASEGEGMEQSVAAMAMMEQDLLDTLTATLDEEKEVRTALAEDAAARQRELERARQEIENRESSIEDLESDLIQASRRESSLVEEKTELSKELELEKQSIASLETRYEDLEATARQREAQARMLQEELEQKLEEIRRKEEALAQEQSEREAAQARVQELNVQVRVSEEQKRMLQENVETLKLDIEAEREEKKEIQAQATQMAQGITQLAERSQDLTEEFRSSLPVNANTLFDQFNKNRIVAAFLSERVYRGQTIREEEQAMTVIVSDGEDTVALTHLSSTPLSLEKSSLGYRQVDASLERAGVRLTPERLSFSTLDPRIVVTPLTAEEVARLGGEPYYTALEPFKFPEAVLIDEKGAYYGEVEFKLSPNSPGYVRMQSKVFSRIVGEFSPSRGDLVLSKTGELLGLMVDGNYCALISHLVSDESLPLGKRFENDEFRKTIQSLRARLQALPSEIR